MRWLRLQAWLLLNPAGMSAVAPDLSFNTSVSFTSNTNWQNYGGESTLSYLTQMVGLTTQNFVSAATGIALAVALIRAFARASGRTVGNFWVDLTRCTLYVLLPLSIIAAVILVLAGRAAKPRRLCRCDHARGRQADFEPGPAPPLQIAIKQLGTNGGGFWNANFFGAVREPDPAQQFPADGSTSFSISAALTQTFGRMVKDERQGWAL